MAEQMMGFARRFHGLGNKQLSLELFTDLLRATIPIYNRSLVAGLRPGESVREFRSYGIIPTGSVPIN